MLEEIPIESPVDKLLNIKDAKLYFQIIKQALKCPGKTDCSFAPVSKV